MKTLKYTAALICILLMTTELDAQQGPLLSVYFSPVYQNWDVKNIGKFNELTNMLSLSTSPMRNMGVRFVTRYASVSGDIDKISGFSDSQLLVNYNLKDYNIIVNAGVSIPTGKTKLSSENYQVSKLISQSVFGMQTPNFGQGTNIFGGINYLLPLSEQFVLGAGLSYQVRSEYQPLEVPAIKYKPSNEITLTAGFDAKLTETSAVTGDLTGIFYGSDKADGKEVFSPGSRFLINMIYKQYFRFNMLNLMIAYRTGAADELLKTVIPSESEKVNPDMLYLNAAYSQYVSALLNLNYNVFLSSYQKTIIFYSGYTFIGAGFSPELKLSPSLKIPLRMKYMQGSADQKPDLKNYDISIALVYTM